MSLAGRDWQLERVIADDRSGVRFTAFDETRFTTLPARDVPADLAALTPWQINDLFRRSKLVR